MRILKASDYKRMPWKNGAGETVELAVFPPGASVEDFDWRISMASVAADGAFSLFPGIDRTLSILPGEGLSLSVEGHQTVDIKPDTPPYSFPADRPTSVRLTAGPVTDLNVMTRRGRFAHRVTRRQGRRFALEAGQATLVAIGLGSLEDEGRDFVLQPLDALVLDPGRNAVLIAEHCTTVFTLEIAEGAQSKAMAVVS